MNQILHDKFSNSKYQTWSNVSVWTNCGNWGWSGGTIGSCTGSCGSGRGLEIERKAREMMLWGGERSGGATTWGRGVRYCLWWSWILSRTHGQLQNGPLGNCKLDKGSCGLDTLVWRSWTWDNWLGRPNNLLKSNYFLAMDLRVSMSWMKVAYVSVEVASLVSLVWAVRACMTALPRVSKNMTAQEKLVIAAMEHLPTHPTDAAPTHTLFLQKNYIVTTYLVRLIITCFNIINKICKYSVQTNKVWEFKPFFIISFPLSSFCGVT